ncbi:alpha/beta hydrolase [Streptomyces sp. NPDC093085]|uniref:alpha/beta hydrolase family protein n=1 Tax=Streptomyces sp. NPDC093085 TaxID=3155068 RepID=UPI00341A802A
MPDPAAHDAEARDAEAREAAEAESVLSRPAVRPDATAAYGEHPDQVIDFYAPRGGREPERGRDADREPERVPLVVVLHGGAWRAPYDRLHVTPFAEFLARRGFAVANVEYRRGSGSGTGNGSGTGSVSGESDGASVAGRWPETFDDVAAALDALPGLAAAALPQADVRRTVLTGHSAGGHLALWAAARHVLPEGSPWRLPEPPPLRGVVALAPIADLVRAVELSVCGGAVLQLMDGEAEFKQRRESADPAALLPTGIATTVVQGRTDRTVPYEVAEAYVEAAGLAGELVGLTLLEDVGHFPLVDPSADACAVVAEEIAQLAW